MEQPFYSGLLDLVAQPAFVLENGSVCYANPAAKALGVHTGLSLYQFLYAKRYPLPAREPVQFDCELRGVPYRAVCQLRDKHSVYLLERQEAKKERSFSGNTLAHASASMRQTLHEVHTALSALYEPLTQDGNESLERYAAIALRGVYRMQRVADNLDLLQKLYSEDFSPKYERLDLTQLITELFAKAQELLRYVDVQLRFEVPAELHGTTDRALLSALLWNLLSNAAAACGKNGEIFCSVRKREPFCVDICVENQTAYPLLTWDRLFSRHDVSMDDSLAQPGVGVGLSLISAAAKALGGALMLSQAGADTVRALVSIHTEPLKEPVLRCDIVLPKSGIDEGLVGLSTVLPYDAYDLRDLLG